MTLIEDTATSPAMVAERFGPDVLAAVMASTKNADLPKEQRMPDSLERIRGQSLEVWMVKLADRIVNLGPPPAHWTRDKMAAYQSEAETILSALRDASPFLARRLEQRIAESVIYLDGTGLPHLPSRAG
jgi:guanosine-3',5'-bis(diphosphate) 3'-pyrophosphohydrolase